TPPSFHGSARRTRRGPAADLLDHRRGEEDHPGQASQEVEPADFGEDDDRTRVDDPLLADARRPTAHRPVSPLAALSTEAAKTRRELSSSSATSAKASSALYWKTDIPAWPSASMNSLIDT